MVNKQAVKGGNVSSYIGLFVGNDFKGCVILEGDLLLPGQNRMDHNVTHDEIAALVGQQVALCEVTGRPARIGIVEAGPDGRFVFHQSN